MRTLEFQLSELYTNLRRNGILTVAAVVTVMASLAILAMFFLLSCNLNKVVSDQADKAQISAFLKPDRSGADDARLRAQIQAIPKVAKVEYVSPDAALDRMAKSMGFTPEELKSFGQSRLPAKFAVQPTEPGAIGAIAQQLKALPGVEEVKYGENVVVALIQLKRRLQQFGWGALVVLGLATCGIISNAIRLTIYARRREIRIMQLVGATDGFIRMPFLLEGLFHGVLGSLLALGVTSVLYAQLYEANERVNAWLHLVTIRELTPTFPLGVLLLGAVIGLGSSLISIRHFLQEA